MTDKIEPSPALPNKHGRPSKYNKAVQAKIMRCVAKGMPLSHAAAAVGITFFTLTLWRRNRPKFAEALAKAVARGIEKRLDIIEQATNSQDEAIRLRSATWYLEHVFPESYARNRVELTGGDGQPLAIGVNLYLPQKETTLVSTSSEPVHALTQGGDDGKS